MASEEKSKDYGWYQTLVDIWKKELAALIERGTEDELSRERKIELEGLISNFEKPKTDSEKEG